eukprot:6206920-Pleurochrysis_carterae.AAC.2
MGEKARIIAKQADKLESQDQLLHNQQKKLRNLRRRLADCSEAAASFVTLAQHAHANATPAAPPSAST